MHSGIWHGGHYGRKNNIRFHALLKKEPWPFTKLYMMSTHYAKRKKLNLEKEAKGDNFIKACDVTSTYVTEADKQHTKQTIDGLTRNKPGKKWFYLTKTPGSSNPVA